MQFNPGVNQKLDVFGKVKPGDSSKDKQSIRVWEIDQRCHVEGWEVFLLISWIGGLSLRMRA